VPKRTEEREASEQSRLSMVVSEPTELEVEQACAGVSGGGRGEGVGRTQRRKQAMTAMIPNQNEFLPQLGYQEAGPQNKGD
jgi:hypothetical protein